MLHSWHSVKESSKPLKILLAKTRFCSKRVIVQLYCCILLYMLSNVIIPFSLLSITSTFFRPNRQLTRWSKLWLTLGFNQAQLSAAHENSVFFFYCHQRITVDVSPMNLGARTSQTLHQQRIQFPTPQQASWPSRCPFQTICSELSSYGLKFIVN